MHWEPARNKLPRLPLVQPGFEAHMGWVCCWFSILERSFFVPAYQNSNSIWHARIFSNEVLRALKCFLSKHYITSRYVTLHYVTYNSEYKVYALDCFCCPFFQCSIVSHLNQGWWTGNQPRSCQSSHCVWRFLEPLPWCSVYLQSVSLWTD